MQNVRMCGAVLFPSTSCISFKMKINRHYCRQRNGLIRGRAHGLHHEAFDTQGSVGDERSARCRAIRIVDAQGGCGDEHIPESDWPEPDVALLADVPWAPRARVSFCFTANFA